VGGARAQHLDEGVRCAQCHPDASADGGIDLPELRVDGQLDLSLPDGITYDGTCTGVCHGEAHTSRSWPGEDR
jgi:hypothetical protein